MKSYYQGIISYICFCYIISSIGKITICLTALLNLDAITVTITLALILIALFYWLITTKKLINVSLNLFIIIFIMRFLLQVLQPVILSNYYLNIETEEHLKLSNFLYWNEILFNISINIAIIIKCFIVLRRRTI